MGNTALLVGILLLAALGLVAFWSLAPAIVERQQNQVLAHDPYPVSEAAKALHGRILVGDWHADGLLWNRDLLKCGTRVQVDLPRLEEGGAGLQVFTAVTKTSAGLNYGKNSAEARDNITLLAFGQLWPTRTWTSLFERAIYQAEKLKRVEAGSEGRLKIIRSRADLDEVLAERAAGRQVVGAILGLEGLHSLDGDIANLDG